MKEFFCLQLWNKILIKPRYVCVTVFQSFVACVCYIFYCFCISIVYVIFPCSFPWYFFFFSVFVFVWCWCQDCPSFYLLFVPLFVAGVCYLCAFSFTFVPLFVCLCHDFPYIFSNILVTSFVGFKLILAIRLQATLAHSKYFYFIKKFRYF